MNPLYHFVSAPAWMIFPFLIAPFLFTITAMSMTDSAVLVKTGSFAGICTMLTWFYSACTLIYEKFSAYLSIPIGRLKFCFAYVFGYSVCLSFELVPFESLTLFHLFSLVCNVYILYFFSKLVVTVEKQAKVGFREYLGTFVLAWFHVIGVWYLQPRINRIFRTDHTA